MGYKLWIYVPGSPNAVKDDDTEHPFSAQQVLVNFSDTRSFISQIFPLYEDQPTIRRYPLPEGLHLELGEDTVYENTGAVPFYYVLAGDVAKLKFEHDEVSPLDQAMMAYICTLPPDYPLIPCVLF